MFDRLLLLEDGKVAYNGPVEDVVGYFKDCGYEVLYIYIYLYIFIFQP